MNAAGTRVRSCEVFAKLLMTTLVTLGLFVAGDSAERTLQASVANGVNHGAALDGQAVTGLQLVPAT